MIADFLDAETARIDALIAKKRHLMNLVEERWRTRVRGRMRQLSKTHGDTPLKRLMQCLDAGRLRLSAEERHAPAGPLPVLRASGVIDWVDDYLFDETLVFLGEDGAQLADPRLGDLVRGGGEVWVNNHAHALRPLRADPHFLALHLSTFDRSAFVSGATREKITQADMGSIPVPALDVDGQWREGSLLLRSRQASRTVSARLGNQIDLLTELRQALITAAVTGELDVAGATAEEAS